VIVSNTGAVVHQNNSWTYLTAGVISNVQPAVGQYGTVVSIIGQNLLGGGVSVLSVTFGGVATQVLPGGNDNHVVVVVGPEGVPLSVVDIILTSTSGSTVF